MGTKPEVTKPKRSRSFGQIMKLKPKLTLNFWKHEAEAEALVFSKHEAEAEAQVLPSYHKLRFQALSVTTTKLKPKPKLWPKMLRLREAEAEAAMSELVSIGNILEVLPIDFLSLTVLQKLHIFNCQYTLINII